jgi:nucleotide-binding universal stress UspA family protein
VLLATDGRDSTDTAIRAARRIADRLRVPLAPVAVLRPIPGFRIGGELPQLPSDYERARRAEMHREVERRLEPVLGPGDGWTLELRTGVPAVEIAAAAVAAGASLLVIGRGEHRPVDRLLGEEIALQVVRRATVPVLAVHPAADARIRRVVVGMDFSAASIRAAFAALRLMEPGTGGIVSLVHVRPRIDFGPPSLGPWAGDYAQREASMFGHLCAMLADDVPAGVLLETRSCTGHVRDCLLDAALEVEADLIAVGTRGAPWLDRLFVGSVATTVLRTAKHSVLVAPPPAAAERVQLELRVTGRVTVEDPEDRAAALDAFSRRNLGRSARLEVGGAGLEGLAVENVSYRFAGASWDPHDARVVIMLAEPGDPLRHLTHGMTRVQAVSILADDERRDRSLIVTDARGQAVLSFVD